MPIYVYHCTHCNIELEALQKMSDPALTHCEACGHETLQKSITAAGFRFSGSGYYETDEKSKDKQRGVVTKEHGAACGTSGCSHTPSTST